MALSKLIRQISLPGFPKILRKAKSIQARIPIFIDIFETCLPIPSSTKPKSLNFTKTRLMKLLRREMSRKLRLHDRRFQFCALLTNQQPRMRLAAGNVRNCATHAAAMEIIHELEATLSPPVQRGFRAALPCENSKQGLTQMVHHDPNGTPSGWSRCPGITISISSSATGTCTIKKPKRNESQSARYLRKLRRGN